MYLKREKGDWVELACHSCQALRYVRPVTSPPAPQLPYGFPVHGLSFIQSFLTDADGSAGWRPPRVPPWRFQMMPGRRKCRRLLGRCVPALLLQMCDLEADQSLWWKTIDDVTRKKKRRLGKRWKEAVKDEETEKTESHASWKEFYNVFLFFYGFRAVSSFCVRTLFFRLWPLQRLRFEERFPVQFFTFSLTESSFFKSQLKRKKLNLFATKGDWWKEITRVKNTIESCFIVELKERQEERERDGGNKKC